MKNKAGIILAIIALIAVYFGYKCNSELKKPITRFDAEERYVFNRDSGNAETEIKEQIRKNELLLDEDLFFKTADALNVWKNITPGRFAIKKGASVMDIVNTLRKNRQSNMVNFTIKKLQTKEGLASIIGRRFLTDSATAHQFLINADSLQPLGVDTNTLFTIITPDTFIIHYKKSTREILEHFKAKTDSFWMANDRLRKAEAAGLDQKQLYILASIVEEETNKDDEKGLVASVYLNRLRRGMKLGADPTVKFALRDFDRRRILNEDLKVASPYNTYYASGLPPGPICTPSKATIDAVLPIPASNYLFFVAKENFSGYHTFTTNYADHLAHARKYREALNQRNIQR